MFQAIKNLAHNLVVFSKVPINMAPATPPSPPINRPIPPMPPPPAAPPAPVAPPPSPHVEAPMSEPDPACKPATISGLVRTLLEGAISHRKLRWQGWEAPVLDEDILILKMVLAFSNKAWLIPQGRVKGIGVDQTMPVVGGSTTTLREIAAEQAALAAVKEDGAAISISSGDPSQP